MKDIRLILSCLILLLVTSSVCFADAITKNDLVGVGFNPAQADVLSGFDTTSVYINTTLDNVFVGDGSGDAETTGAGNVCVGDAAGEAITTGDENIFIGEDAGVAVTTGSNAIGIGDGVLATATAPGAGTICIGDGACDVGVVTGVNNVVIGEDAGVDISTGADNILIGEQAGANITSDARNIILGTDAGDAIVGGGNDNILIGDDAGAVLTTGDGNVCIGTSACAELTTTGKGVYIGYDAGKSALTNTADRLVITNSDDASPLIDGILTAGSETITFTVPGTSGLTVTGNATISSMLKLSVGTLAAAGSDNTDAGAIVKQLTYVTATDDTKGVILPASTGTGIVYIIHNTVADKTLKVYPDASGSINGGTATTGDVAVAAEETGFFIDVATNTYFGGVAVDF